MGPWGSGHQHNDKLHLSIAAYGRDLLVDAGRFAYTGEVARKFRPYARGSAGHNVILIDGKGQNPGPTHAREPLGKDTYKTANDFDYASNSFDSFRDVEGKAKHMRSVFYVRGEFWVVVDRIITNRPREIAAMWHWHPSCRVERDGSMVKTANKKGNLAVVPVSDQEFKIEFVKGQEEPEIQGWYSSEYNIFEPNITSFYRTETSGNTTLVWLLVPSEKKMPKLDAGIISEDDGGVTVEVKSQKQSWQLTVPFRDSGAANLIRQ
jgi:hypothetical protein